MINVEKLRAGDVILRNSSAFSLLTKGKLYEVKEDKDEGIYIINDAGARHGVDALRHNASRFDHVNENPKFGGELTIVGISSHFGMGDFADHEVTVRVDSAGLDAIRELERAAENAKRRKALDASIAYHKEKIEALEAEKETIG